MTTKTSPAKTGRSKSITKRSGYGMYTVLCTVTYRAGDDYAASVMERAAISHGTLHTSNYVRILERTDGSMTFTMRCTGHNQHETLNDFKIKFARRVGKVVPRDEWSMSVQRQTVWVPLVCPVHGVHCLESTHSNRTCACSLNSEVYVSPEAGIDLDMPTSR